MKKQKSQKPVELVKLDLGYSDRAKLLKAPWPWKDQSVEEFKAADVFQYIPGSDRPKFMNELGRVLTEDAKATIVVNYFSTSMAYADYEVAWPPVCEQSFLYFNKEWCEANKIPFQLSNSWDFTYGYALTAETAGRTQEVQLYHVGHYLNTVQKLQVVLNKHK